MATEWTREPEDASIQLVGWDSGEWFLGELVDGKWCEAGTRLPYPNQPQWFAGVDMPPRQE